MASAAREIVFVATVLDATTSVAGLLVSTAARNAVQSRLVDEKIASSRACPARMVFNRVEKSSFEYQGIRCRLSSVAGRLGYAYRTPYAATKWAIVGLVKSLAIELGPQGIRVNALLLGIVEGPRIEQVIAARATTVGVPYQTMEKEYINKISLRKMTTAQDVANHALYLCSPMGAGISGQPISICGNVEHL